MVEERKQPGIRLFLVVTGLFIVLAFVIMPAALKTFGYDVRWEQCGPWKIPCGWKTALFKFNP